MADPELPEGFKGKSVRIIVCPLNWGLGHASRDIILIRQLVSAGHEVIIAADGPALELFNLEFPELESLRFGSSVRVRYSRKIPAWMKIIFLSPLLLFEIMAEHRRMSRLSTRIEPDVIISDNRYGLWQSRIKSILITHQLSIRPPGFAGFMDPLLFMFVGMLARRFDECWIPDYPGENNLAGDLCHRRNLSSRYRFIGPLSRFEGRVHMSNHKGSPGSGEVAGPERDGTDPGSGNDVPERDGADPGSGNEGPERDGTDPGSGNVREESKKEADLLVILSGPEPQRTQLEKIILSQIIHLKVRCIILQGKPGGTRKTDLTSTLTMYNHLPGHEFRRLVLCSRSVICRSGYTNIMDLAALRKKAVLVPTPGQTEQEYLADYLAGKGMFLQSRQNKLDLEHIMVDLEAFEPVFDLPEYKPLMLTALEQFR